LIHSIVDQSLVKRLLDMVEWHVYKRHQQWARVRQMAIIEEQVPVVFDEEIVDSTGEVRTPNPISIKHTYMHRWHSIMIIPCKCVDSRKQLYR
jgi:hypothetical protein